MIKFGSDLERMACLLHEARIKECWGNWSSIHRFNWPTTADEWGFYQHNQHPAILQALAQARAVLAFYGSRA